MLHDKGKGEAVKGTSESAGAIEEAVLAGDVPEAVLVKAAGTV